MSADQDAVAATDNRNGRGRRRRSGSETRKPSKSVHVRYPLEEYTRLEENASRAGQTISTYVRQKTNQMEPSRRGRRPSPQQRLAASYLAELGKIGSNLNQLARAANMDRAGLAEIRDAISEAMELKAVLQRILRGRP